MPANARKDIIETDDPAEMIRSISTRPILIPGDPAPILDWKLYMTSNLDLRRAPTAFLRVTAFLGDTAKFVQ